ncbi:DMT family transporter [Marivita sp. GX14005]|uniref:DMT family transporter n=1 Tax=Marivita sp. GX14005 TaxID=2942276 RepID=UPI00201A2027|nr:DMT family transporter [Marivita sp. GX14005]MCL3883430.1 DMT family transporter [Marivita sp. GX14005]
MILTPDALLIRLSGLGAAPLVAWRGLSMGTIFLFAALLTGQARQIPRLASPAGAALILAQTANATLFATAIYLAPVAAVLIAVATVPICAALWSWLLYREATRRATWIAILFVSAGIFIAMTGKGDMALNPDAVLGVCAGLGVALSLSLNFTLLRHNPQLPLLGAVGLGALLAGLWALGLSGAAALTQGTLWPIATASLIVLPASFYLMSEASRHTASVNVSLFLLLETVFGPVWVWIFIGEAPTIRMLVGGAIVVTALLVYLGHLRRHA